MSTRRGFIWIVGGLALGFGIAALLGVLVFWAWPSYRRARSPLGELHSGQIGLRYLKDSPVAAQAPQLAEEIEREWERVKELLAIPEAVVPPRVYVYAYAQAEELPRAYSARTGEETTPLAVVDLLAGQPVAGALARLACALAYGGPGNPVFPRGLARYLDRPEANWAAEAVAYGVADDWRLLFQHPGRLLPTDPWEVFFFRVDAPWVEAAPSLETARYLLTAATSRPQRAQAWEAAAAAFAGFVLQEFGASGVRGFWLATSWQKGAQAVGLPPQEFASAWEAHLQAEFARAGDDQLLRAKRALYSGRASQALAALAGAGGEEAERLRALALLASGDPAGALAHLPEAEAAALAPLASAPRSAAGRLVVVGYSGEEDLSQAVSALSRALAFWGLEEEDLPERLVIYVSDTPAPSDLPWSVIWIPPAQADLPYQAAEFVLRLASPLGLPLFDALTQGLALALAHPERDFRREAAEVLRQGKWVALDQPLFDSYPRELAEAEAGALAGYLLAEHGTEAVKGIWQALLAGASPYKAVADVLGMSLDELDQRVRVWLAD